MGAVQSFHLHCKKSNVYNLETFESLPLQRRQQLWPYVASIRYPEILDWRRHLFPDSRFTNHEQDQETEESKEHFRNVQEQFQKQKNLPVEISNGLYLSDAVGASKIKRLKELGITHVLNVGGQEAAIISDNRQYKKEGIVRKTIEAKDEYGYPMLKYHLAEAIKFVQTSHEQDGKCVIHCAQGINRSGVLVAAVTMLLERKNVLEAVRHCRIQRGNVFMNSNQSFQEELVMLAEKEGLLGPKPGSGEDNECFGILESEIPPYREGMYY